VRGRETEVCGPFDRERGGRKEFCRIERTSSTGRAAGGEGKHLLSRREEVTVGRGGKSFKPSVAKRGRICSTRIGKTWREISQRGIIMLAISGPNKGGGQSLNAKGLSGG